MKNDKLGFQLVDVTMKRNKLRYACRKALDALSKCPENEENNLAIRYLQKALSETVEGAGKKSEKDGNTVV